MNRRLHALRTLLCAGLAMAFLSPALALADHNSITYKVTIYNLTAGQPFTPPVIAVHNRRADIFEVGEYANDGVIAIAENGDNNPLLAALASDTNVIDYAVGNAPIVPANNPGETGFDSIASFTITTDRRNRRLSLVAMLICTNDGFTGIDSIRLPRHSTTVYARGYETRTERNTEDFADIVPPCQGLIGESSDDQGAGQSNPLLAEDGVIIPHVGVIGDNDLKRAVHDWADPVAKIVIERVRRY
ncbi:MAG: spondin domain-containing protein [Woeseiaceae bacterium]|nr:spondin domain-containing protein [Woeseiaceae bacterium]